jgi:hypothetical protein
MKKPEIDQIFTDNDPQALVFSCKAKCLGTIKTTVDEVKEDNRIACPKCGTPRDIDVEGLLAEREAIINAVRAHKQKN